METEETSEPHKEESPPNENEFTSKIDSVNVHNPKLMNENSDTDFQHGKEYIDRLKNFDTSSMNLENTNDLSNNDPSNNTLITNGTANDNEESEGLNLREESEYHDDQLISNCDVTESNIHCNSKNEEKSYEISSHLDEDTKEIENTDKPLSNGVNTTIFDEVGTEIEKLSNDERLRNNIPADQNSTESLAIKSSLGIMESCVNKNIPNSHQCSNEDIIAKDNSQFKDNSPVEVDKQNTSNCEPLIEKETISSDLLSEEIRTQKQATQSIAVLSKGEENASKLNDFSSDNISHNHCKPVEQSKNETVEGDATKCTRKRRLSRNNLELSQQILDQCCGHWFPNSRLFLKHLIKNSKREEDVIHTSKLIDFGFQKCSVCSEWQSFNKLKVHYKNIHQMEAPSSNDNTPKISKQTDFSFSKTSEQKENLDLNSGDVISVSQEELPLSPIVHEEEHLKASSDLSKKGIKCILNADSHTYNKSSFTLYSEEDLPPEYKPSIFVKKCPVRKITDTSSKTSNILKEKTSKKIKKKKLKCPPDKVDSSQQHKNSNESQSISTNELFTIKPESVKHSITPSYKKFGKRSRKILDCSKSFSKLKSQKSKLWRKGKCGYDSDESSESSYYMSESPSDLEVAFLSDFDYQRDEEIPTVELDLFNVPCYEGYESVLLVDPKNPNFKVFASMEAIFVGDSALGDLTNHLGYISDNNNVVFMNPTHCLFPMIENEKQQKNKKDRLKQKLKIKNDKQKVKVKDSSSIELWRKKSSNFLSSNKENSDQKKSKIHGLKKHAVNDHLVKFSQKTKESNFENNGGDSEKNDAVISMNLPFKEKICSGDRNLISGKGIKKKDSRETSKLNPSSRTCVVSTSLSSDLDRICEMNASKKIKNNNNDSKSQKGSHKKFKSIHSSFTKEESINSREIMAKSRNLSCDKMNKEKGLIKNRSSGLDDQRIPIVIRAYMRGSDFVPVKEVKSSSQNIKIYTSTNKPSIVNGIKDNSIIKPLKPTAVDNTGKMLGDSYTVLADSQNPLLPRDIDVSTLNSVEFVDCSQIDSSDLSTNKVSADRNMKNSSTSKEILMKNAPKKKPRTKKLDNIEKHLSPKRKIYGKNTKKSGKRMSDYSIYNNLVLATSDLIFSATELDNGSTLTDGICLEDMLNDQLATDVNPSKSLKKMRMKENIERNHSTPLKKSSLFSSKRKGESTFIDDSSCSKSSPTDQVMDVISGNNLWSTPLFPLQNIYSGKNSPDKSNPNSHLPADSNEFDSLPLNSFAGKKRKKFALFTKEQPPKASKLDKNYQAKSKFRKFKHTHKRMVQDNEQNQIKLSSKKVKKVTESSKMSPLKIKFSKEVLKNIVLEDQITSETYVVQEVLPSQSSLYDKRSKITKNKNSSNIKKKRKWYVSKTASDVSNDASKIKISKKKIKFPDNKDLERISNNKKLKKAIKRAKRKERERLKTAGNVTIDDHSTENEDSLPTSKLSPKKSGKLEIPQKKKKVERNTSADEPHMGELEADETAIVIDYSPIDVETIADPKNDVNDQPKKIILKQFDSNGLDHSSRAVSKEEKELSNSDPLVESVDNNNLEELSNATNLVEKAISNVVNNSIKSDLPSDDINNTSTCSGTTSKEGVKLRHISDLVKSPSPDFENEKRSDNVRYRRNDPSLSKSKNTPSTPTPYSNTSRENQSSNRKKRKVTPSFDKKNAQDIRSFFTSSPASPKLDLSSDGVELVEESSDSTEPVQICTNKVKSKMKFKGFKHQKARSASDIRRFFTDEASTTKTKKNISASSSRASRKKSVKFEIKSEIIEEFEGFETGDFSPSTRQLKHINEFAEVLRLNSLFVSNKFTFPIDQLCDWDDDRLSTSLFEKG